MWRVRESYSYDEGGVPVVVRAGSLLPEGDPRVAGRERYLEPAENAAARGAGQAVETATAAPGEQRTVGKPPAGRKQGR
jgi:hypothetical protein